MLAAGTAEGALPAQAPEVCDGGEPRVRLAGTRSTPTPYSQGGRLWMPHSASKPCIWLGQLLLPCSTLNPHSQWGQPLPPHSTPTPHIWLGQLLASHVTQAPHVQLGWPLASCSTLYLTSTTL